MAEEPSGFEYEWMDQLVDTVGKRIDGRKKNARRRLTRPQKKKKGGRSEFLSRVVVIRWDKTETDYTDDNVRRDVRSRTGRPDAFFPGG